ncbi:hypothetical protein JOY44_15225 [Phormidium sp. CLA17]|uniref:hypothetical protein n=1 Tax=Leptolyngbya sp. Cla-17 TaxID=2803751 RepID=UPI001492CD7A|nr:hypothetical protein [Leptolyngbya sp. Cla-17]MBM0742940.1 hypothetical protein [Leptolyngbya sp. Cla-17]
MWRLLKSFFYSLKTYPDLSPDLRMRRRVNRMLGDRSRLTPEGWHQKFWQSLNITPQLSSFIYWHLPSYSGLDCGRIHPSDRLQEDLHLSLVCWFDWEQSLQQDFFTQFEIDLGEEINLETLATIKDLMVFLDRQLLSINRT